MGQETRGRKPKPTLRYYMRGKEGGEIKAYLTYGGRRYYGGRTTIYNSREFFSLFNSDGTLKTPQPFEKTGLVPDCLGIISQSVLEGVNNRLKNNEEINATIFEEEMDKAVEKMWLYKSAWIAGRESVTNGEGGRGQ